MKILFFTARWCLPCVNLKGEFSTFSGYKVEIVDFNNKISLFNSYNVDEIPTLILLNKENKELDRISGYKTLGEVEDWILKNEEYVLDIQK